jgi:hypothetical protein
MAKNYIVLYEKLTENRNSAEAASSASLIS